jgi:hypothetical protein
MTFINVAFLVWRYQRNSNTKSLVKLNERFCILWLLMSPNNILLLMYYSFVCFTHLISIFCNVSIRLLTLYIYDNNEYTHIWQSYRSFSYIVSPYGGVYLAKLLLLPVSNNSMSRSTLFFDRKICFTTHAQGTILYECGIKLGLIV